MRPPCKSSFTQSEPGAGLDFRKECTIIRDHMDVRRPTGVTILAALEYTAAAWLLGLGIVCLFGRSALMSVLNALDYLSTPEFPSARTLWSPFELGILSFLGAALFYCLASGLWRLKNWARLLALALTVGDLVLASPPDVLGPIKLLIPRDPVTAIAGSMLSFILILYLLSPQVRVAFGVTVSRNKWQVPAMGVLALLSLAFNIARSKQELQGMRWHMRHGARISVNGVSFPVYYWYAPLQGRDGAVFEIQDRPGPLRPKDQYTGIRVEGVKDTDNTLSVEQLVDKKLREYEAAGYKDLSRFPLQVGKQTLSCAQNSSFGNLIYCYGDGPIFSMSFMGGDRSLIRFKRMVTEARLEQPK